MRQKGEGEIQDQSVGGSYFQDEHVVNIQDEVDDNSRKVADKVGESGKGGNKEGPFLHRCYFLGCGGRFSKVPVKNAVSRSQDEVHQKCNDNQEGSKDVQHLLQHKEGAAYGVRPTKVPETGGFGRDQQDGQ